MRRGTFGPGPADTGITGANGGGTSSASWRVCGSCARLAPLHPAANTLAGRLWGRGMAEPAQPGWPAQAVTQLDEGLPVDCPGDYRSLLDWQVLAPARELHPSVAALNAGLPAARAVQQAQGEPQTLPDIIETYFAPLLSRRRGLLVFEPWGQRREERQARKRQRSAAQRDDDVRYSGNSYAGR